MSKSWKIAGETNAKVGKVAGVTGLEPAASGVTDRLKVRDRLNLAHPEDYTEP